jgi:hypothetical protein
MDFIQKRRKILPNRDQRFKDESFIFPTSVNTSQKVKEILTFVTSKMAKNGQNRDFFSRAIFFKLKIQSAQFFNRIDSLHAKNKKKTKKCVGLESYDTLRGW